MSITPIRLPLPGEQVLQLSPADAAEAATSWLRRPNLFPGRALTAPTLDARSHWAATSPGTTWCSPCWARCLPSSPPT